MTASGHDRRAGHCRNCTYFRNDPAFLETVFKGLASMSSAHASVRAEDGLCLRHDRYLSAQATCDDYTAAVERIAAAKR
jgi:hypothetical protein